jgi:NADH dehydrogenase FAD-containing subunit
MRVLMRLWIGIESAATPQDNAEVERLLHMGALYSFLFISRVLQRSRSVVVVGGGPTGIEL